MRPGAGGEPPQRRFELALDDLLQAATTSLIEGLPDTHDRSQTAGHASADLERNLTIGFAKDVSPLGVPDQRVCRARVQDHRH